MCRLYLFFKHSCIIYLNSFFFEICIFLFSLVQCVNEVTVFSLVECIDQVFWAIFLPHGNKPGQWWLYKMQKTYSIGSEISSRKSMLKNTFIPFHWISLWRHKLFIRCCLMDLDVHVPVTYISQDEPTWNKQ